MDPNRRACVITLLCALAAWPQNQPKSPAEQHFTQGVRWLHSFEYDDAREEFVKARALDPAFVMAYWGEALSYTEPLWHRHDLPAARAALQRLATSPKERLARAHTERERDYLGAVETLYGAGDYRTRTYAYEEAMRQLVAKHPQDLDAAAFYSLAILGTAHAGRDFRTYMRAAAVAEEVYSRDPDHPGALHYLIHCYDDPMHAPLGLRAARRYAKVAREAPHALHMPSHIFIAMGMWDDVVSSNEASWNASEIRVQAKKLGIEERGYHALSWLQYAYLQQGRYREAQTLLDIIRRDAEKSGEPYLRYHLALMSATYALETRRWDSLPVNLKLEDLDSPAAAAYLFTKAYASLDRGDAQEARRLLDAIRNLGRSEGGHREHMNMAGDQSVGIMAKQLEGLLAGEAGLKLLEEAARIEDEMPFEFGPPVPVKPAHELFGEVLLELGKYGEARAQFARALERTPGRSKAMLGLARATARSGDPAAAREIYSELEHIRRRADVPWSD